MNLEERRGLQEAKGTRKLGGLKVSHQTFF